MKRLPLAGLLAAALGLSAISPARAYDLIQAYRDAVSNDSQLASARAQLAAIREGVPLARSTLLPQVGASATANQVFANSNMAPRTDFTSQNYGIQLSYPLYRLQNVEALAQSKLQASLGEAQFEQARQDLVVRVAQAYFAVLSARDQIATIEAQKRAISEQLAAAKRNFEVGTATVTDQQEAQASFDLAQSQEVAARNQLEVNLAALVLLVGRPVGELDVLRPGLTLQPPQPARQSDWVDGARHDNYSVQQAQLSNEIARREIDRQRYARYPTVDLVGSLAHVRNASANFVGVRTENAAIGVQVAIPLYTGGGIDASVRQAAASHDQSIANLESARRAAEQSTRQAFLGVTSGLAQVRALEAAERSSQLALDSNLLGYQVGVRINIDVLNAQQQLFTTRSNLASARYAVLVNGLQLKSAAGTLDDTDLQAINALLVPASSVRDSDASPSSPAGTGPVTKPTVQPPMAPPIKAPPRTPSRR